MIGDNPAASIVGHEILDTQCIKLVVELTGSFIEFIESVFDWPFWLCPLDTSPICLDSHYEEIDDGMCETVCILSFHTIDEPDDH